MIDKRYLGDGVYATDDGYQVEIFTWSGYAKENVIYFERQTAQAAIEYFNQVFGWKEEAIE